MQDISHLYALAPDTLFDNYEIPELDLMAQASDFRQLLNLLDADERRAVRYYFQHRQGETAFCLKWLEKIEKAIAKINEAAWTKFNQRLAIYDQIENRYWASFSGVDSKGNAVSYWCKTRRRCLLFAEEKREWLQNVCDRSNKTLRQRRFLVVVVNAEKRLGYEKTL